MNVKEIAKAMKKDAPQLASTQVEERNKALEMIKASLEEHKEDIFKANKEDENRYNEIFGKRYDQSCKII